MVWFAASVIIHVVIMVGVAWVQAGRGVVAYGEAPIRLHITREASTETSGGGVPGSMQSVLGPQRAEVATDRARKVVVPVPGPHAVDGALVRIMQPPAQKLVPGPVSLTELHGAEAASRQVTAGLETGAHAIHAIVPVYPIGSRRTGEEGVVRVAVEIASSGEPMDVEIVQSSGYPRLDRAACVALMRARFAPAVRHGRPSTSMKTFEFVFELNDTQRS